MKRYYPATVTKDEGGAFIVQAIDLDNVFSDGSTIEEAIANAEDALAGIVEVMAEKGLKIPEPTAIDVAHANRKRYGDILALVNLAAPPAKSKTVKISVTIDEELLKRIDAFVGNYGRSEFLAGAARAKLAELLRPTVRIPEVSLEGLRRARTEDAFVAVDTALINPISFEKRDDAMSNLDVMVVKDVEFGHGILEVHGGMIRPSGGRMIPAPTADVKRARVEITTNKSLAGQPVPNKPGHVYAYIKRPTRTLRFGKKSTD
jgi:predicted RNase H-like HicB family nuclease